MYLEIQVSSPNLPMGDVALSSEEHLLRVSDGQCLQTAYHHEAVHRNKKIAQLAL
jgi:hypothetical protein